MKKKLLFIDLTYLSSANREKYESYLPCFNKDFEVYCITTREAFNRYQLASPTIKSILQLPDVRGSIKPLMAYSIYFCRLLKVIKNFQQLHKSCGHIDIIYSATSIFVDIFAQAFLSRIFRSSVNVSIFDNFEEINWKLWKKLFRVPQYLSAKLSYLARPGPHITFCYLPPDAFNIFEERDLKKKSTSIRFNNTVNFKEVRKYRPLLDASARDIDFLFIGRLHFDKGVDRFLEGLREIMQKGLTPKAVICGSGSDNKLMKEINLFCHENSSVNYLGYVNNKYEILSRSKVVVVPSRRDSFPTTVMEAAVMGCSVVTTNLAFANEPPFINLNLNIADEKNSLSDMMLRVLEKIDFQRKADNYFDNFLPTYEKNYLEEVAILRAFLSKDVG